MSDDGKEQLARLTQIELTEEELERRSIFLAMCVRNAIEDIHAEFVPDSAMPTFNRMVRNAIYTGMTAINDFPLSAESVVYVESTRREIPDYWEPPELEFGLDRFTPAVSSTAFDLACRHCGAAAGEACHRLNRPDIPHPDGHAQRWSTARGLLYEHIERFDHL